jgi:hypothetical protein
VFICVHLWFYSLPSSLRTSADLCASAVFSKETMPKATSKRRYTMVHLGISRTIEEFTQPERKRLENAKPFIMGDGQNTVRYNHDPARGCEPVTIKMITTDDDPYISKASDAFRRHMNDPATAESAIIRCHKDDGTILSTMTLVRAVIQAMKFVEGNTTSHDHGMLEVILQPEDFLDQASTLGQLPTTI